ncbi:hypothetical protein C8F04DRAFT_1175957 [Mycena alexandri]|uniref:Uncharacterized protein n=1 Tax=Mycena alexandri TaxID=1745969 RepID=A0AAD6XCD7_9AGAR|nr:hypothetical protein C8F04DRAFT_1175957 [Mycena alexandri]
MLTRILSLGNRAIALAGYDLDFSAIRQRSERGGSLYSFKKLSELELDIEDNVECKKFLSSYFGHIFGQVEYVHELARIRSSFGSYEVLPLFQPDASCSIRLKCPLGAPCRLVELWDMQIEVLQQIMAKDQLQVGGVIVDSFLDFEGAPAQSEGASMSILVRARAVNGLSKELDTGYCIIAKTSLSRYQAKESNPELLEMSYHLDLVGITGLSDVMGETPMCDPSAFLLRLTSQTMLAGLKANRASSLAKTVYNRDFFAVRDRMDGHEDVFNFKTARAQAIDYEAERRKGLQEHVVLAFGEIRRVDCMRGRTKENNDACAFKAHVAHVPASLPTVVASEEVLLPPRQGSFYIVLRPRSDEERAAMEHVYCVPEAIGRMLECKLVLERRLCYRRGEAVVKNLYKVACEGLRVTSASGIYCVGPRTLTALNLCCGNRLCEVALVRLKVDYGRRALDDRRNNYKRAPNRQFVAVRDRSDGHDSVFAFKRGRNILINPYSERRWAQPSHSALAYGEIKTVYRMAEAGAFCIVLTCPMSASCDAIYMFVRQLWSLKRILDLDMLESPGAIAVSWFDRSQEDPRMRRRTGSFYVTIRSENETEASEYEQIFITDNPVGKMVECLLGFERRHIGTSKMISKAYELNVIQSTIHQSNCGCLPSRAADYAGRMALATVEYGRDFAAVREGSYPGGSEFYFAEEKGTSTESEIRDGLVFRVNILGTCTSGPSCDVICVKIRPPSDTNCEGYNAYWNQLEQLRRIIGVDYDNGSTQPVGGSWFDASRDFKGWGPEENCFYVFVRDTRDGRTERLKSLKTGTCVAFCGTMSRLDEDAENTRNYYIWALEFLTGQFPSRRERAWAAVAFRKKVIIGIERETFLGGLAQ